MTESAPADRILVLASENPGKVEELSGMLRPLAWTVKPQSHWNLQEAEENGLTFIENALIKARHACCGTGHAALGDDSGLIVDALGGKPGIRSSRFAGPDADDQANNMKLLASMAEIPETDRGARFYCAMVFVRWQDDPAPLIATGTWHGRILRQPVGDGGFGYDPLFWVPEQKCSSAELPPGLKNRLSHRGKALRELILKLDQRFP